MNKRTLKKIWSGQASERELLRACREGHDLAIMWLVERHVVAGIGTARRAAPPDTPTVELLDAVHDAFITAFDEAFENHASSMAFVFHQLVRALVGGREDAGWTSPRAPVGDAASFEAAVTPAELSELRADLMRELRAVIGAHGDGPRRPTAAERIRETIRTIPERVLSRVGALGGRWPDVRITRA